jgi:hypothetical protein
MRKNPITDPEQAGNEQNPQERPHGRSHENAEVIAEVVHIHVDRLPHQPVTAQAGEKCPQMSEAH